MVSFPFLFGVMFGDIMHGTWLTLFASYICLFADRSKKGTLANAIGPLRYLFLLMGIFSLYCGLIYNDFSSAPTMIMGRTCYTKVGETKGERF